MTNPIQPIIFDEHRVARFKKNCIVSFLVKSSKFNLNDLHCIDFSLDDWTQFYQLIGYSVSGAGDLEKFDKTVLEKADTIVEDMIYLDEKESPQT